MRPRPYRTSRSSSFRFDELKDVSHIALDEEADHVAWGHGAAALKELYGAPWGTTGPAQPRTPSTETEREAE